jgi:hypothetical protein
MRSEASASDGYDALTSGVPARDLPDGLSGVGERVGAVDHRGDSTVLGELGQGLEVGVSLASSGRKR